MKIPLEWLKQYVKTTKTAKELSESFTYLGLMLDKPITEYKEGDFKTEVLDLEHRMDRSDWLSILGCARDIAAFENEELLLPELYTQKGKPAKDKIKIEVACPDLVNRFNTRTFKNITVKPSPDWLKYRLESYGIPSINNIVDITNYVMVELGQPMHAQDIAKMEKPEIVIRNAKDGEQITTLLGETLTLDREMFVLTQNGKATVIGGIVGGAATGIDANTKDIVLDAGNYNQTNIRKTSRKLKIQNETVLRYDKFLHPELTQLAIERATQLILELAGGEYYENVDWYPTIWPLKKLTFTYERLYTIGGIEIEEEFVKSTLDKLGYKVLKATKHSLTLEIPYFRTDVEVEDDIVSDILRIYGYKNIPQTALATAVPKEITPKIYKFEDKLRDICVNLGLQEHITDPLVNANEKDSAQNQHQVILENAQSQLKNALRTNIYDGLKNVAQNYLKHKITKVKLFEVGKIYFRKNKSKTLDDFDEKRITQIYVRDESLSIKDNSIEVRKVLDGIFKSLGINKYFLQKDAKGEIRILANKDILVGFLNWDHIYLENETLMNQPIDKTLRVHTQLEQTFVDDISVEVPAEKSLGEIERAVENISDKIIKVSVAPQEYSSHVVSSKKVLISVIHKSGNFQEIREKIIQTLN